MPQSSLLKFVPFFCFFIVSKLFKCWSRNTIFGRYCVCPHPDLTWDSFRISCLWLQASAYKFFKKVSTNLSIWWISFWKIIFTKKMFVRKKLVMLDTTTTMTTATTTTTTATLSLMTDHALLIGSNNIYYFGWSNSSEHNSAARLIIFRCCFVTFFMVGFFSLLFEVVVALFCFVKEIFAN